VAGIRPGRKASKDSSGSCRVSRVLGQTAIELSRLALGFPSQRPPAAPENIRASLSQPALVPAATEGFEKHSAMTVQILQPFAGLWGRAAQIDYPEAVPHLSTPARMLGIALRSLRLLEIGVARGQAAHGRAIASTLRHRIGLFEIAPVGSQDFVGNRVFSLHAKSHQQSAKPWFVARGSNHKSRSTSHGASADR
jgi:hypothetical protein